MEHVLDNPIYHALRTKHQLYAMGSDEANYYIEDVAPFAGLKNNSLADLADLYKITAPESSFVVFTPTAYKIPDEWKLIAQIDMFQMVYDHAHVPKDVDGDFEDLHDQHVDEMIELVKLTQPGPFKSRTIALGNYTGVFNQGKLVSMAGHRFHPAPYIEISAVCTHPDHLGNGYAYRLLREQVKRILAQAQIPFLHVRNDNLAAVKLYQKLGFEVRTDMLAYVLQKQSNLEK
ncbi:GNAT family N-acetyltransferase [Pedobacter insulae]|uniref:FR47-like protein n=1 Tax=Pedobacter insulae TaxID=414048 RepID=A0A1I2ZAJ0_9SPHI|nr:GNAT family N-acetyltransferase [Pedobacter insulae]SFH34605.1 FR47-like protein [Pedobacter insulae]